MIRKEFVSSNHTALSPTIIKHIQAPILVQQHKKASQHSSPYAYTNRRIHTSQLLVNNRFKTECSLLLNEIKRIPMNEVDAAAHQAKILFRQHINHLWLSFLPEYIALSSFSYLNAVFTSSAAASTTKFKRIDIASELIEGFVKMMTKSVIHYYIQKKALEEAFESAIEAIGEGIENFSSKVSQMFRSAKTHILDGIQTIQTSAELEWYTINGVDMYTFIANTSDESCEICISLNGEHFAIEDAEAGVNLPPMHPNCGCSIRAYPELPADINILEVLGKAAIEKLKEAIKGAISDGLNQVADVLDDPLSSLGEIWDFLAGKSVDDYCGAFTTITLEGEEYRIRLDSFSAVSIGPDGEFIKPENLLPRDAEMLELMKERDSLPEDSSERKRIEEQIDALTAENIANGKTLLSVSPKRDYSYYVFGGDVTDQLYSYMQQAEITYSAMHDKSWIENLPDFYELVRNSGEMDLKNQPEWQHSAYIFDGEVVDKDAMGNINYGYFGRHCNIPDIVLLGAAGVAQFMAGTYEWEFWFTFLDDPRDNDRVSQGIEIYDDIH